MIEVQFQLQISSTPVQIEERGIETEKAAVSRQPAISFSIYLGMQPTICPPWKSYEVVGKNILKGKGASKIFGYSLLQL